MKTITKKILDEAIANGEPILLSVEDTAIVFMVESYDKKTLRGSYAMNGKKYDATFHRNDVKLLNW